LDEGSHLSVEGDVDLGGVEPHGLAVHLHGDGPAGDDLGVPALRQAEAVAAGQQHRQVIRGQLQKISK
jgi:hypothetical protein